MGMGILAQQEHTGEATRPTPKQRSWGRWLAPSGLLCAALCLHALAGHHPEQVERIYSRRIYLHIGHALAYVNKFISFSLAEALAPLILCGLTACAVWQIRRLCLGRVKARALALSALRVALWAAGLGGILFLMVWGLNYHRRPLAESLDLSPRPVKGAELEEISRTIISEINRNYEEGCAGDAGDTPCRLPLDETQLYEVLESSYRQLGPQLGGADGGGFGPPKPFYFSGLMSRLGISGMFSPFTGEPNFNAEQPDSGLPFAVAHEMAHQRGYAREDDADFVAFLVCVNASHPYVRYSGHLRSMDVLYLLGRLAPRRYQEVVSRLAPGPLADLDAGNSFWLRRAGPLSRATSGVTDAYLKVNRVGSGLRNYREVVRLIISYYLTRARPSDVGNARSGGPPDRAAREQSSRRPRRRAAQTPRATPTNPPVAKSET